jgi:hypothetical protein
MKGSPNVGDKRPIEQVDDTPRGDAPPKRANPVVVAPSTLTVTSAAAPAAASVLITPQGSPPATPVAMSSPSIDQDEMSVDHSPPAVPAMLPVTYSPPDAARVLQQPDGGFPIIYGLDQGLLSFIHNNSINTWKQRGGESTLVYIGNDGLALDKVTRIKAIEAFFRSVFPDFPAPEIGLPELYKRNDKKVNFKPAMPFCISGRDNLIAALKTRKCWPTPSVTLFITSLAPEVTDFAICIAGFPLERSEASDLIVTRAARDAIKNDVHLCAFITNNNDNLSLIQPDQYINFVVGSVVVRSHAIVEDGVPTTVFNLYVTPPTCVPDRVKQWIQGLKQLRYGCFHGTGFSRPAFYCDLCKGRDHPTTICPFAAIKDWPVSPPFTNEATANIAAAGVTPSTRGGSGSQRGRGGRRGRQGQCGF